MELQRILTSELGAHVGQQVTLKGWMHRLRKMGEINFLVLRDRAGVAQAVLGPADVEPLAGLHVESGSLSYGKRRKRLSGRVFRADGVPGAKPAVLQADHGWRL